ncbi:hypothetical protein [Psychromonas aquimarina]|uniref:hypothetical protein n=1 Tax=Psychromonas aquimarina TaxID=444919 RepID=UPI00040A12F8|nr:hypothetical protein [Psychromonas aquimarina]
MELKIKGSAQEQLLFHLLGIKQMGCKYHDSHQVVGLILGKEEEIEDSLSTLVEGSLLYVRLPDTDNPLKETQKLSRLLAKAIGQADVHL